MHIDAGLPSLENQVVSFVLIAVGFIVLHDSHTTLSDLAINPRIYPLSALVIYASFMKSLTRTKLAVTYFQQYGSINSLSSYTTIRNDNNRWYQDQRGSRTRL